MREELGFESSYGDPDMWYKPKTKPNGEKYYSYLLIYVDDVISIDINPKEILTSSMEGSLLKRGVQAHPAYI